VPGWDDAPLRPQGRAVAAARGLGCCGRWRLRRVAAAEVRDSGRAVDTDTQQYRPVAAAAAAPVTRVPTRWCASGARAARDRRGASARAGERPFSAAVLTGICLHAACSCHELLTEEWERPRGSRSPGWPSSPSPGRRHSSSSCSSSASGGGGGAPVDGGGCMPQGRSVTRPTLLPSPRTMCHVCCVEVARSTDKVLSVERGVCIP
jgi:hypothetical protein